jgi:hypothetical protein
MHPLISAVTSWFIQSIRTCRNGVRNRVGVARLAHACGADSGAPVATGNHTVHVAYRECTEQTNWLNVRLSIVQARVTSVGAVRSFSERVTRRFLRILLMLPLPNTLLATMRKAVTIPFHPAASTVQGSRRAVQCGARPMLTDSRRSALLASVAALSMFPERESKAGLYALSWLEKSVR